MLCKNDHMSSALSMITERWKISLQSIISTMNLFTEVGWARLLKLNISMCRVLHPADGSVADSLLLLGLPRDSLDHSHHYWYVFLNHVVRFDARQQGCEKHWKWKEINNAPQLEPTEATTTFTRVF